MPATIGILFLLFLFQRRGTAGVASVFGPIMLVWFVTLAALGIVAIVANPTVLIALNPLYAVRFFVDNGSSGYVVLGAVFLVVTGGEALYADMGHFGPVPIRVAWFALVLPALLLNYFGQGAELLRLGPAASHPFYHLAPDWLQYPLIGLATVATVIASQAVISGAFSLTNQAMQLGQSPRMHVVQTSPEMMGQIYIPGVNWLLMLATIALVLGFGSSSNLAAAYGVAVNATMVITSVLSYFVMRDKWHWSRPLATAVAAVLLCIDVAFFGSNLLKIPDGGWFPLVAAAGVYFLMATWSRGRQLLAKRREDTIPLVEFVNQLRTDNPVRVPGTAVFLTGPGPQTSPILLHHLKHNRVLNERVIVLTVVTQDVPRVPTGKRLAIEELGPGFYRVWAYYGFMQSANIPVALRLCQDFELIPDLVLEEAVYYLGRASLIPTDKVPGMMVWREKLFAFMARNALNATAFYGLPPERVIELGIQVEI